MVYVENLNEQTLKTLKMVEIQQFYDSLNIDIINFFQTKNEYVL